MPALITYTDRANAARARMSDRDYATVIDIVTKSVRWGDMTPKQAAYVESLLCKAERPAQARATVDLTRINTMFDRAAKNLKKPFCIFATYKQGADGKFVVDAEFRVSAAPATGSNPGSLYVKRNGAYQGKIARDGTFSASREADQNLMVALTAFAADPMASAIAYGQATGNCARCARKLTNPVSVEAGMGPICRCSSSKEPLMRLVDLTALALDGGRTAVTATSSFTGNRHTLILPIDIFTFNTAMLAWEAGRKLIQEAFPTLDKEQREFLITGTTQAEWDAEFGGDDDDR